MAKEKKKKKEKWKAKNSKNLGGNYKTNDRKVVIEYSSVSDMHWLGLMAEDNKELTIEQLLEDINNGKYLANEEVINVLKAFIHFNCGNKSMYELGFRRNV